MFSVLAVQPQQSLSVITRASFFTLSLCSVYLQKLVYLYLLLFPSLLCLVTPFPFSQLEITNSITVRLKLGFFYTGTTKDVRRVGSGHCLKFSFVDVAHSWRSFTSAMSRLNEAEHRTANQQPRIHLQLFSHRHRSVQSGITKPLYWSCIYTCNSFHCCLEKLMSKTTVDHQPLKNRSLYDV